MTRNVLILETSTESGSVAIARDGQLVAERLFTSRDQVSGARTESLAPAVSNCLALASMSPVELSAIVCGDGPGGFTSLRSAAALAKGLCSALHIPLYCVSSLEMLAWSATLPDGRFIAAIGAGRGEWFAADVECDDGHTSVTTAAYLVGEEDLRLRAAGMRAQLMGHGMDIDVRPRASAVIPMLQQVEARGPVDLGSWEPTYGRLAEAQVKWEAAHGRRLAV
jgi:tRNA threonylcarbamoyladenosine biosynthesis protein TsaB